MKGLFTKMMSGLTPSCKDMSRLCSESLDRKLTLGERIRMCMHGWICSWCIDYSDQVQKVNHTVKDEGESLAELKGDRLSEDCKARMRALLEETAEKDGKEG
ncbi:hypothetical protein GA003_18835 [Opitutia bacterium ISCC 52]|nr:hypothetical protein GA003_18835 [Opitutae bacterium ISCC 52]